MGLRLKLSPWSPLCFSFTSQCVACPDIPSSTMIFCLTLFPGDITVSHHNLSTKCPEWNTFLFLAERSGEPRIRGVNPDPQEYTLISLRSYLLEQKISGFLYVHSKCFSLLEDCLRDAFNLVPFSIIVPVNNNFITGQIIVLKCDLLLY